MKAGLLTKAVAAAFLFAVSGLAAESVQADSVTESVAEPVAISPFEDVAVSFTGWNYFGRIDEIITDSCPPEVLQWFSFEPEEQYDDLCDGDTVVIRAVYDEEALAQAGFVAAADKAEFPVEKLWHLNRYWGDFHDDAAWVEADLGDLGVFDCVVSTEGEILFISDNGEGSGSDFYHGVCQMEERLMDREGNTIWSVEDAIRYGDSIWGSGSTTGAFLIQEYDDDYNPIYHGYTKVVLSVDCFDFTGEAYGIVDFEGKWLVEPVRDLYGYASEEYGVCTPDLLSLYNILTGEYAEFPETDEGYQSKDETYRSWVLHNQAVFEGGMTIRHEDDGYPKTGFYDEDGNLKIDLSDYNLSLLDIDSLNGEFCGGYRSLIIPNAEGAWFYTIIDEEGNRVLNPVRGTDHGRFTGTYFARYNDDYTESDERYAYCDLTGEKKIGDTFWEASDFRCGRAFVRKSEGYLYCIDENGERVF